VAQNAAELSGRKIKYSPTFHIDEEATLASGDNTVHEWLHEKQVLALALPNGKIAFRDLSFHFVNRLWHGQSANAWSCDDPKARVIRGQSEGITECPVRDRGDEEWQKPFVP